MIYERMCPGCGEVATFTMTEEQIARFTAGEFVQYIFPDWSLDDREMLISGTCPECWEDMWAEGEEDFDGFGYESDLFEMADDVTYSADWYVD